MRLTIGIAVAVLLLVLMAAIATRPNTFRVERTATIAAPAEVVFGYVNDFHQWTKWSPFEGLDPNLKRTYAGPEAGLGAQYSWAGNSKAGAGSMVITESAPGERVALDLHFTKPMEANNLTEFTFKPAPEGVTVTWAMSGKNTFVTKAMSLVMSMDKMVGPAFEKGLATLKTLSEAEAKRRAAEAPAPNVTAGVQ
jgi:uncharacterized protein YndB with AHSA1/START domain